MQLFVRIRGRSHGPFAASKLTEMVHRGQLTRVHMVSLDGQSWKKAAEYPELFDNARLAAPSRKIAEPENTKPSTEPSAPSTPPGGPPNTQEWYYSDGTASFGPYPFATIKRLCDTGELSRDTLVWKPDFDTWTPAGEVPGIFTIGSRGIDISNPHNPPSDSTLPSALVEAIAGTAGWVMFLAITMLLASLGNLIGFVLLLAFGGASSAMESLFAFIHFGIFLTTGLMLVGYARGSARLRYFNQISAGIDTMKSLARLWVFLGIIAIIEIAITAIGIYLLVVSVGAFSRF